MKDKILKEMRNNNWLLTVEELKINYDKSLGCIKGVLDYFMKHDSEPSSVDLNDIDQNALEDTVTFLYDFLRAIETIDDVVGNAHISLSNEHHMKCSMGNLGDDTMELESEIRRARWEAKDICTILNYYYTNKKIYYKDWTVSLFQHDRIVLKSKDGCENINYLTIEREGTR